jgi:hypothetical protein
MNSSDSAMWERIWRSAGLQFVLFFVIAWIFYGDQPKVGASAADLVSFYDGDRTRILIATIIMGFALLNLLWFAAAITSTLRDAGQGGWGTAATAASAALGTIFFVTTSLGAALSYSIAGSGNETFISGLNDVTWALFVIASFPAAMLVMAGSFGLWRAGILSKAMFTAGVAAVILVLLGGTTWASDGFWAPDGAYSRFVVPIVGVVWVFAISGVLLKRPYAEGAPKPAVSAP